MGLIIDDDSYENIEEENLDELMDDFDDFNEIIDYSQPPEESIKITDTENIDIIEKQKRHLDNITKMNIMEDRIVQEQLKIYPLTKGYRSLILEYFTPDVCIRLEKIVRSYSINNNQKMDEINKVLREYKIPFSPLGGGTNRYGILIDGYAVKIAYDKDGMVDNKREFMYSLNLQPYVIKTYECSVTGLLSVCEYVMAFTESEACDRKVQNKMREILKEISSQFFIGDVGITTKNYGNWGRRRDSDDIVILDYAYIYAVAFKQFQCSDDGGTLYYDRDFINLICPTCGKKYSFAQLRKKITKEDQKAEIGDITEKGYVVDSVFSEKKFNHKFVLGATDNIMKILDKKDKKNKKMEIFKKEKNQLKYMESENNYHKSVDEIINELGGSKNED
jgi:hypothetical protein